MTTQNTNEVGPAEVMGDSDMTPEERLEYITGIVNAMSDYVRRNTLNFQIEKLDDYIRQLQNAVLI